MTFVRIIVVVFLLHICHLAFDLFEIEYQVFKFFILRIVIIVVNLLLSVRGRGAPASDPVPGQQPTRLVINVSTVDCGHSTTN